MKVRSLIKAIVFISPLVMLGLVSCGGGGSESSTTPTASVIYGSVPVSSISVSSYINSKENSFFSNDFPKDSYGYNPLNSDAYAFFKYTDGTRGLVASINQYNSQLPVGSAISGRIVFYKQVGNVWQVNPIAVTQNASPCIHARKVLVSDFNNDGNPDFAIMCPGYDAPPFPGEKSTILLSTSTGYNLDYVWQQVGFYHGGSSQDFNNDGYPDIAMTTMNGITVFLNDKTGHFAPTNDYTIPAFTKAFHVELVDINGDGKFDVVAGSHEWQDRTQIVINPGNNKFANAQTIVIPSVPGAGTIVDFVFTPSNNSVYILRTGDGQSNGTTFYEGLWLQKFSIDTRISTIVFANQSWTDSRYQYPSKWLRWIDEEGGFIVSNWGNAFSVKVDNIAPVSAIIHPPFDGTDGGGD